MPFCGFFSESQIMFVAHHLAQYPWRVEEALEPGVRPRLRHQQGRNHPHAEAGDGGGGSRRRWRGRKQKKKCKICQKIVLFSIISRTQIGRMKLFANGFVLKLAKWWDPIFNDLLVAKDLWGRKEARNSVKVS